MNPRCQGPQGTGRRETLGTRRIFCHHSLCYPKFPNFCSIHTPKPSAKLTFLYGITDNTAEDELILVERRELEKITLNTRKGCKNSHLI